MSRAPWTAWSDGQQHTIGDLNATAAPNACANSLTARDDTAVNMRDCLPETVVEVGAHQLCGRLISRIISQGWLLIRQPSRRSFCTVS